MTALVREWLLGITGAAILTALAEGIMPEGGVKQVGKLVCGLALLAVVLKPLSGERERAELVRFEDIRTAMHTQLQQDADGRMRAVIEEKLAAYSTDKGAQLGITCRVQVTCAAGEDGIFLPQRVLVWGVSRSEQQQELAQALAADLGLEREQILFQEGEGP